MFLTMYWISQWLGGEGPSCTPIIRRQRPMLYRHWRVREKSRIKMCFKCIEYNLLIKEKVNIGIVANMLWVDLPNLTNWKISTEYDIHSTRNLASKPQYKMPSLFAIFNMLTLKTAEGGLSLKVKNLSNSILVHS